MSLSQSIFGHHTVSKLHKALLDNDIKKINDILTQATEKKWDVKKLMLTPTFSGLPLLFSAVSPEAAQILLTHGADPLKEYKWGKGTTNWFKTNLRSGHPEFLAQSIYFGAYLDLKNMTEAERQFYLKDQYLPVFKALLATASPQRPFDINDNYDKFRTPTYLMGAAMNNAAELGAWLMEHGAKLRAFKKMEEIKNTPGGSAVKSLQISLDLLIQKNEFTIVVEAGHEEFINKIYEKFCSDSDIKYFQYILEKCTLKEKSFAVEQLMPRIEKKQLEEILPLSSSIKQNEKSTPEIQDDSIPKTIKKKTHKI